MIELEAIIEEAQTLEGCIFAVPLNVDGTATGGADSPAVSSVSFAQSGNTVTETTLYEDGTSGTSTINFDANGNPVSVVEHTTNTVIEIGYVDGVPNSLTVGGVSVGLSFGEGFA